MKTLHYSIRLATVIAFILLLTRYYKIGVLYIFVLFASQILFKGCVLERFDGTGRGGMIMDRFHPNEYVQMWLTLAVVIISFLIFIK